MLIAIHHQKGSFSDRWIEYLENQNVSYKIVNCFDSDILNQLSDSDGLMWHWNHATPEAFLFARQLVFSVEAMGKRVYPNANTCWHYDDKVGQKYLLEGIGAPLVASWVFYTKKQALEWIEETGFPKVFKLRGGYGSNNVKLVNSKDEARSLATRAFSGGFSQMDKTALLKNRIWKFKQKPDKKTFLGILKGVGRQFSDSRMEKVFGKEKSYLYFQDFLPGNDFDTRLIIIGNRCFGIRRYNRKGDFRASGSGLIEYQPELFDMRAVAAAFEVVRKLKTQSLAFDFVFNQAGSPEIIEISYAFNVEVYDPCPGYWNEELKWVEEKVNLQYYIVQDFIEECRDAR
ncbi:hypothetical protein [Algoriphagus sp. NG3]|uniref:ATP-grasp domain-containing protein n=1 Tax=unclassified Algoriphagus TaxID=2641541 RepID=UPI002A805235|nr:hypothetical protein [Algoriphagus sp. NG3]WPR77824.1 hypothetical protein SLW71_10750 [Algoriphagus sp. NG3]